MKILEEMKELIEDELKAIKKKGTLTPAELDSVHKAVETIKYIDELCCEEEYDAKGYSGRYYSGNNVPMDWNRSYSGSDGTWNANINDRYSSNGHHSGEKVYDNYSYAGRYSREGARSNMMNKLEDMLKYADNERDRAMIQSWMDRLTWG